MTQLPLDLHAVQTLVHTDLNPLVNRIDRDGFYPTDLLRQFGDTGLYAAHIGPTPDLNAAITGMAEVAQSCLSTAFAVWCQDACGWYLTNSDNTALKQALLPDIAAGRILGGTGLSNPMKAFAGIESIRLSGERVEGGYLVTGVLPWVSNLAPGHVFGAIFHVPAQNRNVMAILRCNQEDIKIEQRTHFCALEGTGTVVVMVKRAFIPDSDILADPAEPYLIKITPGFILLQAGMALGLLRGAIQAMETADVTHGHINAYLDERPEQFRDVLATLEKGVADLAATPERNDRDYMKSLLQARLAAAEWVLKAVNSAMLHAGTKGYLADGEAQRRLREAYFIAIVTPSIKHLRKELHDLEQGRGTMAQWRETLRPQAA